MIRNTSSQFWFFKMPCNARYRYRCISKFKWRDASGHRTLHVRTHTHTQAGCIAHIIFYRWTLPAHTFIRVNELKRLEMWNVVNEEADKVEQKKICTSLREKMLGRKQRRREGNGNGKIYRGIYATYTNVYFYSTSLFLVQRRKAKKKTNYDILVHFHSFHQHSPVRRRHKAIYQRFFVFRRCLQRNCGQSAEWNKLEGNRSSIEVKFFSIIFTFINLLFERAAYGVQSNWGWTRTPKLICHTTGCGRLDGRHSIQPARAHSTTPLNVQKPLRIRSPLWIFGSECSVCMPRIEIAAVGSARHFE